jgi:hypothetical protein
MTTEKSIHPIAQAKEAGFAASGAAHASTTIFFYVLIIAMISTIGTRLRLISRLFFPLWNFFVDSAPLVWHIWVQSDKTDSGHSLTGEAPNRDNPHEENAAGPGQRCSAALFCVQKELRDGRQRRRSGAARHRRDRRAPPFTQACKPWPQARRSSQEKARVKRGYIGRGTPQPPAKIAGGLACG